MPALETLARFLYRKGKNPTSAADTRELAHDLIDEQAGGVDARQKAFAGLKFECKSAIDAEARNQARALGVSADALTVPQRTLVRTALSGILVKY
jgi:hypothetical protein